MADNIMAISDSLHHYDFAVDTIRTFKLGVAYDVSMTGMAIDKLGHINSRYSKYMDDYVNLFLNDSGVVYKYNIEEYNIDKINFGKHLLTLYERTGEEKYRLAVERYVEQMHHHPKTAEGAYWHKKKYPHQMWLDGLYMGMPFLARYARDFNQPEWFDVAANQIKLAYRKTLDPDTGLLYHAQDESKAERWADPETGQSPSFWGRAMGWYMMAVVDVLDYLPENHKDREDIILILNHVSEALLKVRDEDTGLWYQVLDMGGRDGNYLETSGSAMFIYAFAKGANRGYLPPDYFQIAGDAFDQMVDKLVVEEENGLITLTNASGGCGLGGSNPYRTGEFDYYVSVRRVGNDVKAVGPFILAAIELDK
jgi:unsaturated rhamnogalacturonyl hydrolase